MTYLLLAPKYHFLCVHDLSHSMCSTNLSLLWSICPLGTINDVSWNIAYSHYVGGTHEWHQWVDVTKIATNVLVPYRDNAINSHHPDASASKNYNIANQLYCATYIVLQRYNVTTKMLDIFREVGYPLVSLSTHWGRATHICVSKLITTGSHIGLSPGLCQTTIWVIGWVLLIWNTLQWNPNGDFSFTKMHLKISSERGSNFVLASVA